MSNMKLSGTDLVTIAGNLKQLEELDIEVSSFKCAGHTVIVGREENPSKPKYFVKGITNGVLR